MLLLIVNELLFSSDPTSCSSHRPFFFFTLRSLFISLPLVFPHFNQIGVKLSSSVTRVRSSLGCSALSGTLVCACVQTHAHSLTFDCHVAVCRPTVPYFTNQHHHTAVKSYRLKSKLTDKHPVTYQTTTNKSSSKLL